MLKMLHAKNGSKAAGMDTGNVAKYAGRTARGCKPRGNTLYFARSGAATKNLT